MLFCWTLENHDVYNVPCRVFLVCVVDGGLLKLCTKMILYVSEIDLKN